MNRPALFPSPYDRRPQPVSAGRICPEDKPLPPLETTPRFNFMGDRAVSLEPMRAADSRPGGTYLAPPRPSRRDQRHAALSMENLRTTRNAYSPSRDLKQETGPESYRSTSSTAVGEMSDPIFVGPPIATDHPLRLGPEPKRPRMEVDTARSNGHESTSDLAFFLRSTGPPGRPSLPPRFVLEPFSREEQGTLKRMIGLGVSTFRKRKDPAVAEIFEKLPMRAFPDAHPSPKIVQKISKNGIKYLQIVTDEASNNVNGSTGLDKSNEPESPRISAEIANSNVIDVEDFEKFFGSFSVQARDSPFENAYNHSPANSAFSHSTNKRSRTDNSGFGLSILESSGSELASPTATHSSATSPTLTDNEKNSPPEPGHEARAEVLPSSSDPTLGPLNMSDIAGMSSLEPPRTEKKEDEEWIQREMMQIRTQGRTDFHPDSPIIGLVDANGMSQPNSPQIEMAEINIAYRAGAAENWPIHGEALKQTFAGTSPKRSAIRPSMRQSKSSHDVQTVSEVPGSRISYGTILPLLQSPVRPRTSGERDEDITALPQIKAPTAPLPSTPDKKKRKISRPHPLSGFPVPPPSSGIPSPTHTVPLDQLQSTRSSVCSINTSTSRRGTSTRLQSRVEHLERENRLLQAALQAVLRTSGALNGCPCGILKNQPQQAVDGNGKRRESADSQESNVSALDLYHRTRLARVSNGARSL